MKRMPLHQGIHAVSYHGISPENEQALARLRCAHCRSLINCNELARAVLTELQRDFDFVHRQDGKNSALIDSDLIASVREGIERFLCS